MAHNPIMPFIEQGHSSVGWYQLSFTLSDAVRELLAALACQWPTGHRSDSVTVVFDTAGKRQTSRSMMRCE